MFIDKDTGPAMPASETEQAWLDRHGHAESNIRASGNYGAAAVRRAWDKHGAKSWPPRRHGRVDRAINALLASSLLLALSPLLVLAALAIKLDSPGPVFFKQERRGRSGTVFRIFKFRTMSVLESGHDAVQCKKDDARVTRVGKLLRRTSIDELPQLLNVMRGEMMLVGPRPHPVNLDEQFAPQIPNYMARYAVPPGLTGLAQIRGHRGPTETIEVMSARVTADLEYVGRRSTLMDIGILLRTLPAVLIGTNAH